VPSSCPVVFVDCTGACGAAIGAGIFVSVLHGTTPLSGDDWGLANLATARCLQRIGAGGGPRCCKRDTFLSIEEAAAFANENLGISMPVERQVCTFYENNRQCQGGKCPFFPCS
jgi:hypothetical protein